MSLNYSFCNGRLKSGLVVNVLQLVIVGYFCGCGGFCICFGFVDVWWFFVDDVVNYVGVECEQVGVYDGEVDECECCFEVCEFW